MACLMFVIAIFLSIGIQSSTIVVAQSPHLHIGMFDWDDNLLVTKAYIYLENLEGSSWVPRALSTAEFARVQQLVDFKTNWRSSTTRDWLGDFSDEGGNDVFLNQVMNSVKNLSGNAGGALLLLKYHLVNGFPISIVTARSHAERNLRAAFQWFISPDAKVLSDSEQKQMVESFIGFSFPSIFGFNNYYSQYFNDYDNVVETIASTGQFVAVSNPVYSKLRECGGQTSAFCKAIAMQEIVSQEMGLNHPEVFIDPVVISFSDDDSNNIRAITKAMLQFLVPKYPTACLRVYNTSDAHNVIVDNLTASCSSITKDVIPSYITRRNHY
jgi:hypothetical protein